MFNRDEIEILNRYAINTTRLTYEDGIDWDNWHYYPQQIKDGHFSGGFTDGHDYAGLNMAPMDGWMLEKPLSLPDEAVAQLLRGLQDLQRKVSDIAQPLKREDRRERARVVNEDLRNLLELFRDEPK